MNGRVAWTHAAAVIAAVVLIQVAELDQTLIAGRVRLDLPLFLVIGIGFVARSDDAALLGFIVGLTVDLFQFGPFGVNALIFCLVGWVLAEARVRVLSAGRGFRTAQGAMAAALATALTWLAGAVFGQDPPPFDLDALIDLGVMAVAGAILVHPATRLARWMLNDIDGSREGTPASI